MLEQLIGQTLSHYRILRAVGEDRIGTLFLARDNNLQREVIVKVFDPSVANRPNFRDLFSQSARAAAQLDHPNVIRVLDIGKDQSYQFIVLEYIPGGSLADLLADLRDSARWITLAEAVQLIRQISYGVDYLRSQNDLQPRVIPEHVQFKPGQSDSLPYRPVFTDTGLSELLESRLIESGEIPANTYAYLAPERAAGRGTDARSDVYALGVLLYELTTGQLPFPIQTLADAVRYHLRQPPPTPRSIRPDMPEALEGVIQRALEKNPANRYPSPAAMARDLEVVFPTLVELKTPPPAFERVTTLMAPYQKSLEEVRPTPESVAPEETRANPTPEMTSRGKVDVVVENTQLSVEPGNSVMTNIFLSNQGAPAGYYRITVAGIPESWVSISPQVVQLQAGEQRTANLTIQPARTSQTRAGRYPLTIRVSSQPSPEHVFEVQATLSVGAFSKFASQVRPQTLGAGQIGAVTVENQGNTAETFTINFGDREGALVFTPPQAQLRLVEGQSGTAEFKPALRQPRWVGSEAEHPFLAQVLSATGETQTHGGQFISRPMLPTWMLGLLLFVCLCLAGSMAFFFSREGLVERRTTATLLAAQTETAALQATLEAGTLTATFLVGANEETLQAVTATAQAQAATATAFAFLNETATAQAATATSFVNLTETAQAQAATETAQALIGNTATAQAATAIFLAGQTATAQAATQAAEDAQAATQTAQANMNATETALALTPEATTPPPPSGRRLAYIHGLDTATARTFEDFLEDRGFEVDLILTDAVTATDFSPYRGILLGPDTGEEGVFLGQDEDLHDFIDDLGLPILGLEEGGASFFGQLGFPIGWEAGVTGEATQIVVLDRNQPVWSDPNPIEIPEDGTVSLYENDSEYVAIDLETPPAEVTLFASLPDNPSQYLVLGYQDRYEFWGFENGPDQMTDAGRLLFLNLVDRLVPEE